jgi:signal transduction histidine kinase
MSTSERHERGSLPLLYRVAPRTLRGRLIATTLIVSFVVVAATFAIASVLNVRMLRVRAETGVGNTLHSYRDYLVLEGDEMQARMKEFGREAAVAAALKSGDASALAALADQAFVANENASRTLVVRGPDGTVLYRHGTPEAVAQLERELGNKDLDRYGPVATPAGPGILATAELKDRRGAAGKVIGSMAMSQLLDEHDVEDFATLSGRTVELGKPGTLTIRNGETAQIADFAGGRFRIEGSQVAFSGTLIGIDGKPVGDARIVAEDPGLGRQASIAWISVLASSVFAGIIGLSVGVVMADLVREPVDKMVGTVKKEGYRAIEGMPYSGVSLDNPRLPREFRELGAVIDGLLYGLSARQAELKRATETSKEAEEALAVTVNESPLAKILVQDGLIKIANPAVTDSLGLGSRDLLGRKPADVFDSIEITREDGTPLTWADLVSEAESDMLLARVAVRGRGERWLEIKSVHPHAERHDRILLALRDVTDTRRLEELRSEIISMISHDLRSPLTVIVGYLDLLTTELPPDARDKAIDSARRNALRMESMLDDLLNATRAEELFAPKVLAPVDACDLAEEVVTSMRATAPHHTLEVVCEHGGTTLGEERRLRQALVNLVGNAIKYSPEETTVTVRVNADAERVRFAVEDQGPGIPDDMKRKVFDRFTRLQAGGGKPGMGLGLYIVKVVTEGHGGRVHVEDGAAGGARFVIDLPAAEADRPNGGKA